MHVAGLNGAEVLLGRLASLETLRLKETEYCRARAADGGGAPYFSLAYHDV
jgi:hypothetical protein